MTGESKGWISLYRSIQDHWLWQEKPFSKGQAWLDLLLSANHKEAKVLIDNTLIKLEKGSFFTSELKLVDRWGWSKKKVRNFIELLQKDNMILKGSTKKGTKITIVNYEIYQTSRNYEGTTEEPQENHKGSTEEPFGNTNNNDNNDNNVNNDNKKESKYSSQSLDICKYFSELLPGQSITQHIAAISTWIEMYGYDWTKEAIQKCASSKNKFIKPWIEKVLKTWQKEGKEDVFSGRVAGIKQANGSSTKEPGEGELLAERAQKLYGDKIQDIECDF